MKIRIPYIREKININGSSRLTFSPEDPLCIFLSKFYTLSVCGEWRGQGQNDEKVLTYTFCF